MGAVLGVDLGKQGGLAVMIDGRPRPIVVFAEPVDGSRLGEYLKRIYGLGKRFKVATIACERPGTWGHRTIGMGQRERMGLVTAACEYLKLGKWTDSKGRRRRQPMLFQPQEVKKAASGRGGAGKEAMQYHLRRALGSFPHDDDEHVCDAVAIAWLALIRRAGEARETERRRPSRRRAGVR